MTEYTAKITYWNGDDIVDTEKLKFSESSDFLDLAVEKAGENIPKEALKYTVKVTSDKGSIVGLYNSRGRKK